MFSFKRNRKTTQEQEKGYKRKSSLCTESSTYSSLNLTSSLTTLEGEPLLESIPDNKVHLLGHDHPIFIKKTSKKSTAKWRRSQTFTPSPAPERKRFLSQDEILTNERQNHFAERVEFGSNVLIIGCTNPLLVAQVCRKASRVIWYLGRSEQIPGYSNALDLESRIGRNGNLLVKEDFLQSDNYQIKGLFARGDAAGNRDIDFIYAEIKDQATVLGILIFEFFDLNFEFLGLRTQLLVISSVVRIISSLVGKLKI